MGLSKSASSTSSDPPMKAASASSNRSNNNRAASVPTNTVKQREHGRSTRHGHHQSQGHNASRNKGRKAGGSRGKDSGTRSSFNSDDLAAFGELNLLDAAQYNGATANKRGQISLNHLLNFSFPPRQRPTYTSGPPRKSRSASYQPYNKERFVNANFRFLVTPTGDYTVFLADPDMSIEWKDVQQVVISTPHPPACPICLTPPTAGRLTKCGHTYCLPCIYHYLQLNENPRKQWRKCPICWDAIYARDLKSVRFNNVRAIGHSYGDTPLADQDTVESPMIPVQINDNVHLQLMQRSVDSTVALPLSDSWPVPSSIQTAFVKADFVEPPWHFTPNALEFAKLMLATPTYMMRELDRDLHELDTALADAKAWHSEEEIPFIEMAFEHVKDELRRVKEEDTAELAARLKRHEAMITAVQNSHKKSHQASNYGSRQYSGETDDDVEDLVFHTDEDAAAIAAAQAKRAESNEEVPEAYQQKLQQQYAEVSGPRLSSTPDSDLSVSRMSSSPSSPTALSKASLTGERGDEKNYYFYQLADGQHVFLHPLDIRILKQQFHTYDRFPPFLDVPVLGFNDSTMTEDLRKRCKYLSHLPLSCDLTFLEIDLRGIVSKKVLDAYSRELRQRETSRKEKAHREERARIQAEEQERFDRQTSSWDRDEYISSDPFFQIPTDERFFGISGSSEDGSETAERYREEEFPTPGNTRSMVPANETQGKGKKGAKLVWGKVVDQPEEPYPDEEYWDYGEEEIVTKKGKKKLVLMSTGGRRMG